MWNNVVHLSGNLVRDVELKVTESPDSAHVASFSVAVQRPMSKKDAVDYITCVAWGQPADYLGQYGKKGSHIELEGELRTRYYMKDDSKIYVTEVHVSNCHLQKKVNTEQNTAEEDV